MRNFLLGSAATLGVLGIAIGVTLGVWAAVGDAPWEQESTVQSNPKPTATGLPSPTPSLLGDLSPASKQNLCDATERLFTEGFDEMESLLGIPVDVFMNRSLPTARECFTAAKVRGLFRDPAESWLTSQSNVPTVLHPQLVEPTMSWLAGETPVERTNALNEMAAIIHLYNVSHPTTQVVFGVQHALSSGGFTSTDLSTDSRIRDLESDIRRLNQEIDILDLR